MKYGEMGSCFLLWIVLSILFLNHRIEAAFCNNFVKPRIKVFFGLPQNKQKHMMVRLLPAFISLKGSYRITDGSIKNGFHGMVNRTAMFVERFKHAFISEEVSKKIVSPRAGCLVRESNNKQGLEWFDKNKLLVDVFPALPLFLVEDAFLKSVNSYIDKIVEDESPPLAYRFRSFMKNDVQNPLIWCKSIITDFSPYCMNEKTSVHQVHFLTYFFHEIAHAEHLLNQFNWKKFFEDRTVWTRKVVITYFFLKKLREGSEVMKDISVYELFFIWYDQIIMRLQKIYYKIMKMKQDSIYSP